MFSWGEDSQRGFRLKDGSYGDSTAADDRVRDLNLGYHITDLSAGHNVLSFVKSNGNSFIIRTNESKDGRRVRGKQSEYQCVLFIYVKKVNPTSDKALVKVLFAVMSRDVPIRY